MLHKTILILMTFFCVAAAQAQSVFDMPRLFPQHVRYLAQFLGAVQRNDLFDAETAARAAVKIFPNDANWTYNVACICAKDGRTEEALNWLDRAIDCGFIDVAQMQKDEDLQSLRGMAEFQALVKKAESSAATPNPTLGRALATSLPMGSPDAEVTEKNTQWDWNPTSGGFMTTLFQLLPPSEETPYEGPYAELIAPWIAEGTASGNFGEAYVNRDEDRTQIRAEAFPGLTSIIYGEAAQKAYAHVGAANGLFATNLSMIPVIGNSSLTLAQPILRSVPQMLCSDARSLATAFRLAMSNQLYLYDVTPDLMAPHGDWLIAQIPFVINTTSAEKDVMGAQSQMVELLFAALAAMPPETKDEMLRKNLLVPTLQRLVRQNLKGQPDYFSAGAHPVAFDPQQIDGEALIRAAHALEPKDLPPFFQLRVRLESRPTAGIDFFDTMTAEASADTSNLVYRVARNRTYTRAITLEANGGTESGLTYKWFIVSGDPAKIRIRPMTRNGAITKIEIDYHDPLKTRRVDIACIAVRPDGTASAPAFYCTRYLANEVRTYDNGKLISIQYAPTEQEMNLPIFTTAKVWTDTYQYDDKGACTGWTRTRANAPEEHFDARGRRMLDDGNLVNVEYLLRSSQSAGGVASGFELIQTDKGAPFAP